MIQSTHGCPQAGPGKGDAKCASLCSSLVFALPSYMFKSAPTAQTRALLQHRSPAEVYQFAVSERRTVLLVGMPNLAAFQCPR